MLVGRIGRPHGLGGHVVVHSESDNPHRFAAGSVLSTESGRSLRIERSQARPDSLLVRFVDVADRTAAEALTGEFLFIESSGRRTLDEDEFWPDQLIGLAAFSANGSQLGRVDDVIEGAAQYRLVIDGTFGRFEVPFVAALVPDVDLVAQRLVIADIPGLVPSAVGSGEIDGDRDPSTDDH